MRRLSPALRAAPRRDTRGLTLIELVVALAIGTLLMVSAAPFFVDYTANSRLREAGHLLYAEALAAQSEAVKRNAPVRLVTRGGSVQILDRSDAAAPVLLRDRTLPGGATMTDATIDFGVEGRPLPFGTAGSVDVSMPNVTCSADRRCPGLRVDAGGAVRLCVDHTGSCT